jgi:hypothetical protein
MRDLGSPSFESMTVLSPERYIVVDSSPYQHFQNADSLEAAPDPLTPSWFLAQHCRMYAVFKHKISTKLASTN